MNWSRVGNSVFFIGLMLLVVAAILWSAEPGAIPLALVIGVLAVACMLLGGWLWNRPVPAASPRRVPLSQQRPRNKIIAGVAGLVFLLTMSLQDRAFDIKFRFLVYALIAYGVAGVVEAYLDRHFPSATARWDALPALSKIALSMLVIIGAFAMAMVIVTTFFRP